VSFTIVFLAPLSDVPDVNLDAPLVICRLSCALRACAPADFKLTTG
jgi:hypothetical protein